MTGYIWIVVVVAGGGGGGVKQESWKSN